MFLSDVRSWQHRVLQRPPQARRVLRFTALEASPSFTCAAIATAGAAERGLPGQGRLHGAMPTAGTISTARTGQEPSTRLRAAVVAPEQYHQPGGAPRLINHPAATGRRFCSVLGNRTPPRSPAMSRPKCIGHDHPSRLCSVLQPNGSQRAPKQALSNKDPSSGSKHGQILPGRSRAAAKFSFTPTGGYPAAPAKLQEGRPGDKKTS